MPLPGPVDTLAVGAMHSCALLADGRLFCWGRGRDGRLGLGSEINVGDNEAPQQVLLPSNREVRHVAAGGAHTCIVLTGAAVRCWGDNRFGQLGINSAEKVRSPEAANARDVALPPE